MCGLGKPDFEHIHAKAILRVYKKNYHIRVTLFTKYYFKLLLVVDTVSCL